MLCDSGWDGYRPDGDWWRQEAQIANCGSIRGFGFWICWVDGTSGAEEQGEGWLSVGLMRSRLFTICLDLLLCSSSCTCC